MPESKFGRAQSIIALVLALLTIGGALWGGASWAIDYKAEQAIDDKLRDANLVRMTEMDNMKALIDMRLSVLEAQSRRMDERVEYLYRMELERNKGDVR